MENFRQQPNIWKLKVVLFFRLESSKRKFFLLLLHDRIFDTSFRPSQPFFGKRSIFKCKTVNATPGRNYQSWLILISIWPKEWTDRFAHVKMVNKPKLLHTFRKGQRTSVTSERGLRAIERLNYQVARTIIKLPVQIILNIHFFIDILMIGTLCLLK